jgi:hypothetical protein
MPFRQATHPDVSAGLILAQVFSSQASLFELSSKVDLCLYKRPDGTIDFFFCIEYRHCDMSIRRNGSKSRTSAAKQVAEKFASKRNPSPQRLKPR